MRDDRFEPKLGRIGSATAKQERRYLQDVLKAVARAGGRSAKGRGQFHGNRIGRGSGVGRVLAGRDRYAAFRNRRVVVKTRIVKLKGRGLAAARWHLRYLARDGVTRDGMPGELYSAHEARADGKAFLERCEGDRHQFRFIVSADDGVEYEDLKNLTRRLMTQMEHDLGTKLDWVAVDHFNTGHPHSHIVVRGRDERGQDLIIARDYIGHGMRERAAEIVTLDLGPRSDSDIETALRREVDQERFTSLDRMLVRDAGETREVGMGAHADAFRQSLRIGRMQKLVRLGLADSVAPGRWRLAEELEPTLRRMGERGDIIRTMQRAMSARGLSDYAIYDPKDPHAKALTGRIVARGFADELDDRHYLILDGADGRIHYVDIGRAEEGEPAPAGSIVTIRPPSVGPRPADRMVAAIAAAYDGRYTVEIHLLHDPKASVAFAEAHIRRLEALRRLSGAVEREPDGTWIIASDHLERAAAHERMRARLNPIQIETLTKIPLGRQIAAEAATWLDKELIADEPLALRDAGFGREAHEALIRRQDWLIRHDLARRDADRILYRANLLALLRQREITRVAGQLSGELGLSYVEPPPNTRIEGVYRRKLDLVSGDFALIEKSREFTLVPWRPSLERLRGRSVEGITIRRERISWTLGRERGGPSIS
ncbi:MAG: relaxase/mobilization nuclease domain-containing protein [Alphaproteobacteria bacterium]|nr:relaxase/mobilization nuclease domain-containing protein [Alphaproteobacteria bacterium]